MNSKDLLFKKQSNYILFWIVISAILLFLLLFSSFYKYKPYYVTTGIYDKEAKNVVILLENNKLHYINDTKIKVNKVSVDKENVLVGEYISVDSKSAITYKCFVYVNIKSIVLDNCKNHHNFISINI